MSPSCCCVQDGDGRTETPVPSYPQPSTAPACEFNLLCFHPQTCSSIEKTTSNVLSQRHSDKTAECCHQLIIHILAALFSKWGILEKLDCCFSVEQVVAMYAYQPQNEDELQFHKGSVINVINKDDPDWWKGEMNGTVGLFPSNYVSPLAEAMAQGQATSCKWKELLSLLITCVSITPYSAFFLSDKWLRFGNVPCSQKWVSDSIERASMWTSLFSCGKLWCGFSQRVLLVGWWYFLRFSFS